ncbi:hypothetical protein B0H10DRAFT_1959794 [Mycena sp. CBHHK59/15]|nr:hypothetical protein B0H10DRAFT_1959794 [Mycena sp. CBHHK59/15]
MPERRTKLRVRFGPVQCCIVLHSYIRSPDEYHSLRTITAKQKYFDMNGNAPTDILHNGLRFDQPSDVEPKPTAVPNGNRHSNKQDVWAVRVEDSGRIMGRDYGRILEAPLEEILKGL